MNHIPLKDQLEQVLFEFEQCWHENESALIEEFLPSPSSQNYVDILTELVRSDMEFRIEKGQEYSAEQYFRQFPMLAGTLQAKTAIVFEEYRLRIGQGESVSSADIAKRYQIDAAGWPDIRSNSNGRPGDRSVTRYPSGINKQTVFPKVGESFLNFELVGQLGEGAFGKVFLAQQEDLAGRLVVLKFTNAITDEHRLLARLQHTNIVPIHSVHRIGDLQAICMPLLGVATLDDILRQCKKPEAKRASIQSNALVRTVNQKRELTIAETINDEHDAIRFRSRQKLTEVAASSPHHRSLKQFAAKFIQQTAEGLGYAHQKGIVHCDLKPANILVDDDGNAVILDFHLGYSKQENIGRHVGGTLPYMAPEHLRALDRNQVELEPVSDIYSVGVMLYETLTGELPHETNLTETKFSLERLAEDKEIPFSIQATERGRIGEDLASIIEMCLDPRPAKRFQNGFELAGDLDRHLRFQPFKHASNGSLKNRVRKWAKRNPRLSSASTILVASSLIIGAIIVAFMMVNTQLNKLNAISISEGHTDSAESLIPTFTTARGLYDSNTIQEVVEHAGRVINENTWQDKAELTKQTYFGRLESEHAQTELVSAAEFHFWLAEACQHIAASTDAQKYLQRALSHNQCAISFWPPGFTQNSLFVQQEIIRSLLDEIDPTSVLEPGSKDQINDPDRAPNNRVDRILTAYLQQHTDAIQAELVLDKLVEEKTDDFDAWLLLGHTCARLGKFEKAQTCYTVCRSIDPMSSLPVLCRGISKMEHGNVNSALDDLKLADQLTPGDVTITLNYALALLKKRDYRGAESKFDQAIELGTQRTRVWYLRSGVRRRLGDAEGSREDIETFLELVPNDEKSCIARGLLNLKESPELAIEDFERALEFDPRSATAYNNLAYVYSERLHETRKGIEMMGRAIEMNPRSAKFHASRGVLFARIGQRKLAIQDAEIALRFDRSPETLYQVAGLFAQTSKVEPLDKRKAISLLAQAAFRDPGLVLKKTQGDPDILPLDNDEAYSTIIDSILQLQELLRKNTKKR